MSYLPRLSKTYREPQESFYDELEECASYNSLKPASSLLNEKTFNPQVILRHYRYFPHAPPVLPGPSVLEELREHELYREANRMKRSSSKMEKFSKANDVASDQAGVEDVESELSRVEPNSQTEKEDGGHGRKGRGKGSLGRKKSSKLIKRGGYPSKVSVCPAEAAKPSKGPSNDWKPGKLLGENEFLINHDLFSLREKSPGGYKSDQEDKLDRGGDLSNRSTQCTIFGSLTKSFVVPPIINSLLRTLAFLLREVNREDTAGAVTGEKKSLITQIQLILGDLSNQKVEKDFGFDVTYSDFKRLEKILGELQRYMKDVYGDKGEYIDKMEDLRKIFVELKKKELELTFLTEKVQEAEDKPLQEIVVKETDLKNAEITLQNKRLESEQLTAEAEFSCRELRECHKSIAEVEWEIRDYQEQIMNLKKSTSCKSKSSIMSRKSSMLRFADVSARGSKSRESESSFRKKG